MPRILLLCSTLTFFGITAFGLSACEQKYEAEEKQESKQSVPELETSEKADIGTRTSGVGSYFDGRAVNKFWPGEYPNGLAVRGDNVVLKARQKMDPQSVQNIECPMEKGGFYHVWNTARVEAHNLEFFTVVKKQKIVLKEDVTAYVSFGDKEEERSFKKGETITYLGYLAEGFGLLEIDGKEAQAYVEEILSASDYEYDPSADTEDFWMKLDCNGSRGFIFVDDINSEYVTQNGDGIVGYGEAADLNLSVDQPGSESVLKTESLEYVCYRRDDNKAKRLWISLGAQGRAQQVKYEGGSEPMQLEFVRDNMNDSGANPTITSIYNEIYQGKTNGQYTLTHSGIWDYVKYIRGRDSKEFNFTIDHDANPYGSTPCFE